MAKVEQERLEEHQKWMAFRGDLAALLNRYSMENGSDTPDFILADYLLGCIDMFNVSVQSREKWYGRMKDDGLVEVPNGRSSAS